MDMVGEALPDLRVHERVSPHEAGGEEVHLHAGRLHQQGGGQHHQGYEQQQHLGNLKDRWLSQVFVGQNIVVGQRCKINSVNIMRCHFHQIKDQFLARVNKF